MHSAGWKYLVAALALFSCICSHGHGYSFSLQETIPDLMHSTFSKAIASYCRVNTLYDGTINCFSTVAQSSIASNETLRYKQTMQEKDYHKFVLAMVHVVNDHKKRGLWTIMQRCDMPPNSKTIMNNWSFKQKRYPDGTLNKHKARLCAHGGMQTWSQSYWETYAPVVNWAIVCIILAIAKIHGSFSKSIDFVLVFPQADEVPVYMELPIGFDAPNGEDCKFYVLKLNISLYGCKQAGYDWFAKLSNGLQECGFVQSNIDPCVSLTQDALSSCTWMTASLLEIRLIV